MELGIDENLVLPEQDLEGKIAYIAKITLVFPCDEDGREMKSKTEADAMRVQILNKTGVLYGNGSAQIFKPEDFRKFKDAYRVSKDDDLMGKPVISIYTKPYGGMLTGLIPLNMDR